MTLALAAVAGYLAARLLWTLLRPTFGQGALLRENFRGQLVPTAAGIVVALAVVVVEAGRVVAGAAGVGAEEVSRGRAGVVVVVVGMALLGLLDDLAGGGDARGFRGHLGALAHGRLTTGGTKLFGGMAVALLATAVVSGPDASPTRLVADAALVALAANLANLLDRRPGRSAKAGLACFTALAASTVATGDLAPVAVVAGAAAALLPEDLRERLMLGDTGANALGGAVGLGVVLACGPTTRTVVLVVVLVLNLVSEAVSFGQVIDAVPPLRALDRWGRRSPS